MLCLFYNFDMVFIDFFMCLENGGGVVGIIYGSEYQFIYRNYV